MEVRLTNNAKLKYCVTLKEMLPRRRIDFLRLYLKFLALFIRGRQMEVRLTINAKLKYCFTLKEVLPPWRIDFING